MVKTEHKLTYCNAYKHLNSLGLISEGNYNLNLEAAYEPRSNVPIIF